MSLYEKMITEGVGATKAVFGVNKANRGGAFKVTDAKPYVDAVNKMTVYEGQSKEVIDLHVKSVNAHYDVMTSLTDYCASRGRPVRRALPDAADPRDHVRGGSGVQGVHVEVHRRDRREQGAHRPGGRAPLRRHVRPHLRRGLRDVCRLGAQRHEPDPHRDGHPQRPQADHPGLQVLGHEHLLRTGRSVPRRAGVGQDGGRGRAGRGRHAAVHLP